MICYSKDHQIIRIANTSHTDSPEYLNLYDLWRITQFRNTASHDGGIVCHSTDWTNQHACISEKKIISMVFRQIRSSLVKNSSYLFEWNGKNRLGFKFSLLLHWGDFLSSVSVTPVQKIGDADGTRPGRHRWQYKKDRKERQERQERHIKRLERKTRKTGKKDRKERRERLCDF